MVEEFEALPLTGKTKPRVGIVGEILIKFHPDANNRLVEVIEAEGGEAVVPDFLDFMFYCLYNPIYKADQLGKSKMLGLVNPMVIGYLEMYRKPVKKRLNIAASSRLLRVSMIWRIKPAGSYPSETRWEKAGF